MPQLIGDQRDVSPIVRREHVSVLVDVGQIDDIGIRETGLALGSK